MKSIFVTGIGTAVGKTVVSAILVKALNASYWKPIQTGTEEGSDRDMLRELTGVPEEKLLNESYLFKAPLSPHAAASLEGGSIDLNQIQAPQTDDLLIIEGAGGLLVPLNDKDFMIDLIQALDTPVVLVSRHYLGSINHTLLSYETLKSRGISIAGIIFNGEALPDTEEIILKETKLPCALRIKSHPEMSPRLISEYAKQVKIPGLMT